MTLTSHAQNFEDVMLWRALGHVERGFYIDVGAQHPVIHSVSLAFYERGWRGVHVEPSAQFAEMLRRHRPDEEVIQAALGDREGLLAFHEIADTGLSTADAEIAAQHARSGYPGRETSVPCLTLDSILARLPDREVHWLKIDVEGYEGNVIKGWTRNTPRPWVVVVESTAPLTPTDTSQTWERLLLARGYRFAYFDGLNRFYASVDHPELHGAFGAPPNFFDHFVVGRETDFARDLDSEIHRLLRRETELATELQAVRAAGDLQRADYEKAVARHAEEARQKDAERAAVESVLRETGERAAALREELRSRASEAASLIDRLAAHERSLDEAIALAKGAQAEIAGAHQRNDALRDEFSAWRTEAEAGAAKLHDQVVRLTSQLQVATDRIATLERELAEAGDRRDAQLVEIRARQAQLDAAHAELESLTALYRMIESSRSWRWLAPLRRAKAAISRGVSWLVASPRNVMRVTLRRAVMHLHAHPRRKAFVKRRLARWRRLDGRVRRLAGLPPPIEAVPRGGVAVGPTQAVICRAEGDTDALRRALAARIAHITELELHLERQTDRHQREMAELRQQIEKLRAPGPAEGGR